MRSCGHLATAGFDCNIRSVNGWPRFDSLNLLMKGIWEILEAEMETLEERSEHDSKDAGRKRVHDCLLINFPGTEAVYRCPRTTHHCPESLAWLQHSSVNR